MTTQCHCVSMVGDSLAWSDAPSSPDPGGRCWDLTWDAEGRDPSIFISEEGGTDSPCRLLGHRGCSLRLCWFRAGEGRAEQGLRSDSGTHVLGADPFPTCHKALSPLKGFRDNSA